MNSARKHLGPPSRVWPRAVGAAVVIALAVTAARAEYDDKKPAKTGSVVGSVTDRGKDFIEVKVDGEEKARRYVPHFPGRPEGTDKATLELMPKVAVGTRVKLDWLYEERLRVMKVEVLKKTDGEKGKDKDRNP